MRPCTAAMLTGVLLVLCLAGWAQQPEETVIDTTAMGAVARPADWVEVRFTLESAAPSAEMSMAKNLDDAQKVTNKLIAEGVAEEAITVGPPGFSDGEYMVMSGDGRERQWRATSRVTVRLNEFDPDGIYEEAGRIIDLAASVASVTPRDMQAMRFGMSGGVLNFGVNDDAAMRDEAYAQAMQAAHAQAERGAAAAGMKLGKLVRLRVTDDSMQYSSSYGLRAAENRSMDKQAVVYVSLSATYRLE